MWKTIIEGSIIGFVVGIGNRYCFCEGLWTRNRIHKLRSKQHC